MSNSYRTCQIVSPFYLCIHRVADMKILGNPLSKGEVYCCITDSAG